jgi:predicted dehydrogenase
MSQAMKRIGYVDFNLENFHANIYLKHLRNELKDRGFDVAGCTAVNESAGREWAARNAAPYFSTPREMASHVDFYMVLAPSNPEMHWELCKSCFPLRKPTYVDKTFAPDVATAKRIFTLADKYGTPIQTTSALRYTGVQAYVKEAGGSANVRHMVAWGGGRSFEEYAIHPLEMVISCMGPNAQSIMRRGTGDQSQLLVNFDEGRTAVVNVFTNAKTPYAATVTTLSETKFIAVDGARLFLDTASAILDFFETGQPNIPRAESIMVRRILDVAAGERALRSFVKLANTSR